MAAVLTVTPTEIQEGDNVGIAGSGFVPNSTVLVEIPEYGVSAEIVADASGSFSNDDLADKATATLTIESTFNAVADETVVIGAVTYTWKGSVTTTANEVLVGANAAESLANLKAAINLTGPAGKYGSATVIHPTVGAGALGALTLQLYAKTGGTGGNSLASTETMTKGSFAGTTFAGGAAASGIDELNFTPTDERPFTVKASDGTNTVTSPQVVWSP